LLTFYLLTKETSPWCPSKDFL